MSAFRRIKDELKKTLSLLIETETETFAAPVQELKVYEMVVGGKVEIVNPDGTLSPAPDGEYTVDADAIEVKDGLIVSINGDKGEAPKEDAPAEEMADAPAMDEAPKEEAPKDDYQAQIDELKAAIEELKAMWSEGKSAEQKMSSMIEKFNTQMDELNASIKTILITPAEYSKTNTSIKVKDDRDIKLAEMARVSRVLNKNKN